MYIKKFENYNSDIELEQLCEKYNIKNYTIVDGKVNVDGNVYFKRNMDKIPIPFSEVTGTFIATDIGLKSLENSPIIVGGNFNVFDNKLTSLEFSPEYVGGVFNADFNKIKNFNKSSLKEVSSLSLSYNHL